MKPSELIEKGWCQGAFTRDDCAWDVIGAINHSSVSDPLKFQVLCCEEVKHHDLTAWNDAPERTQTEVIALLRKVEMRLGLN